MANSNPILSKLKDLSPQEFIIGCLATVALAFKIHWWALLVIPLCGLLWMIGGTFPKAIRRWGVPIVCAVSHLTWWCLLSIPLGVLILSQGDGFPDHRPTTSDPGSPLGRFVERYLPNMDVGGLVTKLLIAVIFQASILPIILY